jgi:ZIP family zinc transporter
MSGLEALFWGGFCSSALYIGEALAGPMGKAYRAVGLVMAFGAGTMLAAIAYELVPDSSLKEGWSVALCFGLGALVYYGADWYLDERGARQRQSIATADAEEGSGLAMFLGAMLDGVPESFVLGIGIQLGGSISLAFVVAVFVSNIPQGIAGTTSLQDTGHTHRQVFRMWTWLTVACALTAWLGYLVGDSWGSTGVYAQAFAGGAVLTMLADSMMPEAFRHGGKLVGVLTVLGYAVAAGLGVIG